MKFTLLIVVIILTSYASWSQDSLQSILRSKGIKGSAIEIRIDKSDRTLSVFHSDSLLISYPCVLGFNPVDDKRQEGDGCTPEGTFNIRSKYAHKSWSYFIWIDYPNKESWKKFNDRIANNELPDDASIGGEIGIHGVPEGMDELIDQGVDWTLGCISLKTSDIKDLYKSISDSTVVKITP